MKKAIIILTVLFCLLALAGTVSADGDEVAPPSVTQNIGAVNGGYIQIFCDIENASVTLTDYVHGFYLNRTVNVKNGTAKFRVNLDMPVKSIYVSASGYFSQTLTDIQMPEGYDQYVNITVTLIPIPPTPASPTPIISIIGGFCVALSLGMCVRRNRR